MMEGVPNNFYTPDASKRAANAIDRIAEIEAETKDLDVTLEDVRKKVAETEHGLKVLRAARDRARESEGAEHPTTKHYEELIAAGEKMLRAAEEKFQEAKEIDLELDMFRDKKIADRDALLN